MISNLEIQAIIDKNNPQENAQEVSIVTGFYFYIGFYRFQLIMHFNNKIYTAAAYIGEKEMLEIKDGLYERIIRAQEDSRKKLLLKLKELKNDTAQNDVF